MLQTNKKLHTVTPVSKFLAFGLFVSLPFIGGWVGYNQAPIKVVEVVRSIPTATSSETTVAEATVRPHEWYEREQTRLATSTATVTFTGSWQENEMTAWDNTVLCQQLYVRNYPQNELHDYYVQKALAGNTVQQFGSHGLLLNLPWEEIPEADREQIRSATTQEPITLRLEKQAEVGRGASACHSFFSYRGIVE